MCERLEYVYDIVGHLSSTSNVLETFTNLNSILEQINFAYDILNERNLFLENPKILKSNELSLIYRKQGNEHYKRKNYEEALKLYTKSAYYAENGSEHLAIAYANRSAVLFENGYYEECLIDINNAELNNYPIELNAKLINRRNKAESLKSKQIKIDYHHEIPIIRAEDKSPSIDCGANCLEIKYTTEYGRHVIANKRINIGDIVAIEKPFASILLIENAYTHCYNCLRFTYNLVPCKSCCRVGFCGEECMETAWNAFHKHECLIIDTLIKKDFNKLTLIALKIVLLTKDKRIQFDVSEKNVYESENYAEIYNLITNHELRHPKDLFQRCLIVAMIYDLMKRNTSFFDNEEQEVTFKMSLLKLSEAASSNFHEISEMQIQRDNKSYKTVEIGAGAYAFLSLINHSCTPNIVRHCYGQKIVVRAIKPIEINEQILDNYGYHHAIMKKEERLMNLKRQYLFDCNCIACNNDWPTYDDSLPGTFEIDEEVTRKLLKGDRSVVMDQLPRLIEMATKYDMLIPNKSVLEIQEYLKQCYAVLANKRSLL